MRTLKLKMLTQNDLVKVETAARTFGEFKAEVANLGIDWANVKLIDRASKATYEVDDAVLPSVDAILFVMPTQSKAGADLSYKEVKAKIKEFKKNGGVMNGFNYTQASTEELNKFWNKVKKGKAIVEKVQNSVKEVAKEEVKQEVEEENAPETIYLKPGVYTLVVEGDAIEMGEEVELVDETTLADLQAEAEVLKSVIK